MNSEDFCIFILAGQSNMAGRGPLDSREYDFGDHKVLQLDSELKWKPAKDPVHFDKPERCGVGPGLAFVETLIAEGAINEKFIGMLPTAVGGTTIQQWVDSLADEAILKIKQASSKGKIKGILWHQGESDACISKENVETYGRRLVSVLEKLRQACDDCVPIILGEIGAFVEDRKNFMFVKDVNKIICDIPEFLDNSSSIRCSDLGHKGDSLHFDAESARKMGSRYAQAFLKLVRKNDTPPNVAQQKRLREDDDEESPAKRVKKRTEEAAREETPI